MTPKEFIFEYLEADQESGPGSYERMVSFIDPQWWGEVKSCILKLRYFYFLKTSYWLIISCEVKRRANWKCSCGSRVNLQVHHTEEGNKYHGEEHLLLKDGIKGLECLCDGCHEKIHGKSSIKKAEKKRQRDSRKENILIQLPLYPKRIPEKNISGSSFVLTRKLLEELEHERKIVIDRSLYEGWKIHRV